ncbi:hypothetical protein FRC03_009376 [Tulasnella sp. 419]|nr:hypothetical protein FRC03_009376 [Tulasnella sp. 419]
MELQAKNPRPLSLVSEVRRSSAPSIRSFQSSETAVSRATFASDTDHKRYPRPKQWFPTFLRPRVVGAIIALTLGYATAVEFALWRSQYHNGWRTRGLEQFGSVNFLKSVLPVAVVMPLVMLYDSMHELLLQLQAHVVLSKGRAKARETVLLSYQGGRFSTIQTALINRHWIVLSSAVLSMICLLLSPLASGLLTTKPAEVQYPNYMVTMKKRLGLDPEILTLEHFAAGAGYAEAAVYHNLSDPPFVYNLHWAIAEFVVPPKPSYAANATVIVPTVAVETECNCDQADSVDLTLASAPGGNHTFTGKWYDCTITLQIPDEGIDQYGVETIMECPSNAAQPPWFKPITFWFFSSEIKQVAMVFCQPKISVYNVLVEADLGTGLLKEVTVLDQNVPKNEMSGEPMNGRGYNG